MYARHGHDVITYRRAQYKSLEDPGNSPDYKSNGQYWDTVRSAFLSQSKVRKILSETAPQTFNQTSKVKLFSCRAPGPTCTTSTTRRPEP